MGEADGFKVGQRRVFSILFQAIDDKFTETLRDDESLKDEHAIGLTLPWAAHPLAQHKPEVNSCHT